MTRFFLGVDIGNTKSHALLTDENGRALGFGCAGSGSWESVGIEGARRVLHDIIDQAIQQAGIRREQIKGAGFGFAGYDWPEDRELHRCNVESLGLAAPFTFGNDTLVGLVAGAREGWGVVVVAGTSNNCRGRDAQGREGRVTGMGSWMGEYGGASEIVARAVAATAMAWTKRGPETSLSHAFIATTGAKDVADMLAGLVRNRYAITADNAPLVFRVAEAGDEVALEIICWAGRELGSLANGVIRQLNFERLAFDVILSGSLYKGSPALIEAMRREIQAVAPGARLVRLRSAPVTGGVLLGMEQAGLNTAVIRPTLMETTNALIQKKSE